jgi:thiol-disulfide isomerase/thioredoxin
MFEKRISLTRLAALSAVVVLSLALVSCSQRTKGPVIAPHFALKDLSGKVVSSDTFKGKPTLVVFWATWCPTCKEELPTFNALKEKGIQVVAIALNQSVDAVKEYVREHGIEFPVLMTDQQVELDFGGIRFLPTAFLIDSNWKIVGKVFGKISTGEVVHAFEKLKGGK